MEAGNDNLEQGWKDSYSLKEWKANKDKLKKLADMLPKVFEQKLRVETVPGFILLNEGITYKDNEPIEPCQDYVYKIVWHKLVNHEKKLRSVFMDTGMFGIEKYIEGVQFYSRVQAEQYPHLYQTKQANETN